MIRTYNAIIDTVDLDYKVRPYKFLGVKVDLELLVSITIAVLSGIGA